MDATEETDEPEEEDIDDQDDGKEGETGDMQVRSPPATKSRRSLQSHDEARRSV